MTCCALCEVGAGDLEAVLLPTRVDVLFPMMMTHADDTDAWPSVVLCEACAEITRSTFHTLAEDLSTAALCALTSADLLVLCRLALPDRATE